VEEMLACRQRMSHPDLELMLQFPGDFRKKTPPLVFSCAARNIPFSGKAAYSVMRAFDRFLVR
jgi:hypothetical protein